MYLQQVDLRVVLISWGLKMSSVSYIAFKDEDGILRRFEGEVDHHTRMKIRLLYDGLTQSEFFRTYVEAYIDGDPHILEFVERIKKRKGKKQKSYGYG